MTAINDPQPPSAEPTRAPKIVRVVTITHGESHDGRLPVVVTIVPVEDFDAGGGVFVDFRQGSKDEQIAARAEAQAASDELEAAGPDELDEHIDPAVEVGDHAPTIAEGDAAIAALAAREAKAEAKVASGKSAVKSGKYPIQSRQIGQGMKLTTGQAETLRAEVALPAESATAEAWYVRGRFVAASGGHDLKSSWQRV